MKKLFLITLFILTNLFLHAQNMSIGMNLGTGQSFTRSEDETKYLNNSIGLGNPSIGFSLRYDLNNKSSLG